MTNKDAEAEAEDDRRPRMIQKRNKKNSEKLKRHSFVPSPSSSLRRARTSIFNHPGSFSTCDPFSTAPAEVEVPSPLGKSNSNIHKACVVNYIIVEDEEALLPETKMREGRGGFFVRLLFFE